MVWETTKCGFDMWLVQTLCYSFHLCRSWVIFIWYSYLSNDRDILLSGSTCGSRDLEKRLAIKAILSCLGKKGKKIGTIIWSDIRVIFSGDWEGWFYLQNLIKSAFSTDPVTSKYSPSVAVFNAKMLLLTRLNEKKAFKGNKIPDTK